MEFLRILLVLAVLIAVTVVPVMLAAKWARARRSGFLASLGAVVVATLVAHAALALIGEPLIALPVALVLALAAYALVLGTSFVAAVGIAVVAIVLQLLIVAGLALLGLQVPFVGTVPTAV